MKKRLTEVIPLEVGSRYQSHAVNADESLIAISTEAGDVAVWSLEDGLRVGGTMKLIMKSME